MKFISRLLLALMLLVAPDALAVSQSGSVTSGHCTQWAANQTIEDAGAACGSGSGGSPGGSSTNVQYNNAGSFAGNSNFTYDGTGNVVIGTSLNVDFMRDKSAVTSYFSLTGGVLGILPSGTVSVDWINRVLYDASNGISVVWDVRQLHDSSNLFAIDWQNRLLTASNGSTNLIDFSNVNANGNYYFSSGILQGNGSGLTNVRGVWTTSGADIYNNNPGGVGVGQTTPLAQLHVTPTAPLPSNFTSSISVNVSQGYAFGSGDKSYNLYGENSSVPVFTTPITTTFSEPPSSNFDPTGGSASFNSSGSGYTASGYDFQYQWWALYNGNTQIGNGSTTTNDTGTDTNDGSSYSVDASVTAPSQGTPSGYLVQCQGSNPNAGQYQVVGSTSFSDTGTGWSSLTSYTPLLYNVILTWSTPGAPIDNFTAVNSTVSEYIITFGGTTTTDDTTWTSGSPTVTPTGDSKTAIFDGSQIDINGVSYIWPSSLPSVQGFLSVDNVGNITPSSISAGAISATNDQVLFGAGGVIGQSANLRFNGGTLTLNADFVLNEIRDNSSSGTLNNYSLAGISTIRFSNPVTITGFAGGVGGKVVNVMSALGTPITLKNLNSGSSSGNQITTPTGTDMTAPANSLIQLVYEAGSGTWFVGSIGKPDVTLLANTWTQNQTFNAVNLITDTTTGMKIGTATTQKLGFFNATPVVQQGATTDLGVTLSNLGFRASGTAYPITTSGAVTLSSLTVGSPIFAGTSGLISQNNANYFWDNTNKRLGIQNNTPTTPLSVGDGTTNQDLITLNSARAWIFGASNSGASTDLTLRPSSDLKNFRITSTGAATNYLTVVAANTASSGSVILSQGGSPTIFGGVARLKGYTVSTLPTGTQGDTAFVTDALAPTFLVTIVGGGTVVTPVFYNGTNWVAN